MNVAPTWALFSDCDEDHIRGMAALAVVPIVEPTDMLPNGLRRVRAKTQADRDALAAMV